MFESSVYFEALRKLKIIHSDAISSRVWNDLSGFHINHEDYEVDQFRKLPLGKMNEFLFAQMLLKNEKIEVLEHGYQHVENGITVGEIDFLLRDKTTKKLIHLELATKLYLVRSQEYVGPNLKDKLNLKIAKGYRQIELLKPLWETWEKDYGEEVNHSNLIIGDVWEKRGGLAKGYSSFNREELEAYKLKGVEWFLPSKKEWFVDSYSFDFSMFHSDIDQIEETIENQRSPMVIFDLNGERCKRFVTFW